MITCHAPDKGGFYSEGTDVFVISQTDEPYYFPELEF